MKPSKELFDLENELDIPFGMRHYKPKVLACPICKGSGNIPQPYFKNDKNMKEIVVLALRRKGYSIRQIMKFLNFSSPHSISYIIGKSKKRKDKE